MRYLWFLRPWIRWLLCCGVWRRVSF